MYGSARTKQRFMVDLVTCKQTGTHEAYIGDIRSRLKLVVGAFTDKRDPSVIKVDDLLKCIYINGLDQVYFDRPINRLVEDLPDATADAAMALCQQYSLDRGPSSSESTSFASKILVADAVLPLPHRGWGRPSLGPFPAKSSFCLHCWSYGFQKEHDSSTCLHI